MQLKKPSRSVQSALMAASCALIGATAVRAQSPVDGEEGDWQADSALLYYKEDQGRVQAIEPVVSLSKDFGDEHVLGLKLTYDSLSGGSPNGALPSHSAQTFATPSGTSFQAPSGVTQTFTTASGKEVAQLEHVTLYTTQPGEIPLDPNFHDQRIALSTSWQQPFGAAARISLGGEASHELDFMSVGVNGAIAYDFNNKNTTLSLGGNFEADSIRPIGGVPVGGSDYALLAKGGNESKTVGGALVGLTQVLGRRWLAQLNYSYDSSHGYQTDPYKILSVIDAGGNAIGYRFEARPRARARQSLYLENKFALGRDVLDLSLRFLKDDWGIRSQTAEIRYRWELANGAYVEPHVRYYKQTGADFYNLFLNAADVTPEFASADPRLASFKGTTFGVKFGMPLSDRSEVSLRIEQYQQTAQDVPVAFGQLQGLDLNPGLKSLMAQFGFRFRF
jgi:Protein of unknown function (DUF3570)